MCFIDTFLRRLTAYRGESCLQKYAGCQSAFSQLLFSTRTLPSFSATYILASTSSLFFFYFIPFCSHRCPLCPVSAQLPGIASAAAEPIEHPLKVSVLSGDPLFSCQQRAVTGLTIQLHAEKNPKYQPKPKTQSTKTQIETTTRASQARRAASGASAASLPPAALPEPSGHSPLGTTRPPGRGEHIRALIPLPSAASRAWGSHTGWGKELRLMS